MPVSQCHSCGYEFDGASQVSGEAIMRKPGYVSLCLQCGALGRYEDDLTVRPATEEDLEEIKKSAIWPLICEAQQLIRVIEATRRAARN